jgi:hypothetical protein
LILIAVGVAIYFYTKSSAACTSTEKAASEEVQTEETVTEDVAPETMEEEATTEGEY